MAQPSRGTYGRWATLGAAMLLAACTSSTQRTSEHQVDQLGRPGPVVPVHATVPTESTHNEIGLASWYGARFHGRRTASGERYDMNALTAAHPSLPFETRVQVTNLRNGRSVTLLVNDRGPYVNGRIIDVSRRAAEVLGFRDQGTTVVRIEVIGSAAGGSDRIATLGPQFHYRADASITVSPLISRRKP